MLPDRVSSPGPLAHESDALPTALCGPAAAYKIDHSLRVLVEKYTPRLGKGLS